MKNEFTPEAKTRVMIILTAMVVVFIAMLVTDFRVALAYLAGIVGIVWLAIEMENGKIE